jgi:MFS family permease
MGDDNKEVPTKWYHGITKYQWLILAIACAGWIFDVYEGQIFNITRGDMLNDLLSGIEDEAAKKAAIDKWGDWFLAAFLLGGTAGGLLFGSLADRYGRRPIMIATILTYSVFAGLTYFATELWQVATLRFFVAMGVGGEWAVAAALVAEVFPKHARTHASGIFHASSVVGTWMAAIAGIAVGTQWRLAYLIGVIPALLVVWVRAKVKEPEGWKDAQKNKNEQAGSYLDLFGDARWRKHALLGMALAAVGLASFWAVGVATQGLAKNMLLAEGVTEAAAASKAKFAYGIVQTVGAGVGLLSFGPLCAWLGRRRAFVFGHIGAFLIVPITCYLPQTYDQLLFILPVFGFFTLCMHAGYAVYFPELFPNHLRATGTSFCFNVGRIVAAPMLILSGMVKAMEGINTQLALSLLATTFLLGLVVVAFLPETKGQDLPE